MTRCASCQGSHIVLQEIIMTVSNLNQNNLKNCKRKEMELPGQRNTQTVHLGRESPIRCSEGTYTKTLQSCIPNRIPNLRYSPLSTQMAVSISSSTSSIIFGRHCRDSCTATILLYTPVEQVLANAVSQLSSCIILQCDNF